MKLGTSNCVHCSRRNPKRSAKYVYHVWTWASSTARAGTSCETEQRRIKKFIQYTMDLLSIPNNYTKKETTPWAPSREEARGQRMPHRQFNSRRSARRRYYQGIHDRCIRFDKFRRNMIENGRTEDLCRQMEDLADEDHTHHLIPEEIDILQI